MSEIAGFLELRFSFRPYNEPHSHRALSLASSRTHTRCRTCPVSDRTEHEPRVARFRAWTGSTAGVGPSLNPRIPPQIA
jgi:hypothetical protein